MMTSSFVCEFVRRKGLSYFCKIKQNCLDDKDFETTLTYCTTVAMIWAKTLNTIAKAMRVNAESDFDYNDLDAAAEIFNDIAINIRVAAKQFDINIEVNDDTKQHVISVVNQIGVELEDQDVRASVIGQFKLMVMTHVVKLILSYIVDYIDRYRYMLDLTHGITRDDQEIDGCFTFIGILKACFLGFMEMEYQLIE